MITFETKCYENDWEFILKGNRLQKMIDRCQVDFAKKVVVINNVNDIKKVKHYADKKISKGIIDEYYVADDHADAALRFFNIEKESFKGGYYYSIAELVGIYLCQTTYLLHFSSDTMLDAKPSGWINEAITIFKDRNEIAVANPVWDHKFSEAAQESTGSIGNFYLGYGFSDQCYLVRTADFKKQIYNEKNTFSERYPKYGGELFEKRVDSYMQNHQLLRITSKEASYLHKNFPKDKLQRLRFKLDMYLNRQ